MKELIETIQLSNDKSSYLIELLKHDSGLRYVKIEHILGEKKTSININPKILSDLIEVLSNYKKKIDLSEKIVSSDRVNQPRKIKDKVESIQSRYLKGVPIKDLAMQFDLEEKYIEMILENKGIEIVSNIIPNNWNWRRKRKKKR